jgi:WD40 repeat protein
VHTQRIVAVAFDREGRRLVSSCNDGRPAVFDVATGEETFRLAGDGKDLVTAFAPSGDALVCGGLDGTVRVWPLGGVPARLRFAAHAASVNHLAFADGGRLWATASDDGTIALWEPSGAALARLRGHAGDVFEIAFSPDETLLASAGHDRTVRIWGLPAAPPLGPTLSP